MDYDVSLIHKNKCCKVKVKVKTQIFITGKTVKLKKHLLLKCFVLGLCIRVVDSEHLVLFFYFCL